MKIATCHPERQHYAKGRCRPCYNRSSYTKQTLENRPPAACHPDRPEVVNGTGLCMTCYDRDRRKSMPRAVCHPGRPVKQKSTGFCEVCVRQKRLYGVVIPFEGRICDICQDPLQSGTGKSAIDHDHRTGLVRGVLCDSCNKLLGFAKDNPDILQAAIEYLHNTRRKVG